MKSIVHNRNILLLCGYIFLLSLGCAKKPPAEPVAAADVSYDVDGVAAASGDYAALDALPSITAADIQHEGAPPEYEPLLSNEPLLSGNAQSGLLKEIGNLPVHNVWGYIKKFGSEPKNYATYSYVLTGRNGGDKYTELVNSIQISTATASEMAESKKLQPEELNIFLIPAVNNTDFSAYKPDYEVSKSLLAVIDARSKLSFDRPGPYIITLYQPISTLQKNNPVVDMLYVDLTNINKGVIAELVRTYKQAVLNEKLDGLNKLSSLRLSLLNLAFMTEESIGFAKTASASLDPVFSGGKK